MWVGCGCETGTSRPDEAVQTIEAGHGVILLDSNNRIRSWDRNDVAEGAAIVGSFDGAGIKPGGFQGEEHARLYGFGKEIDGDIVGKKEGIGGIGNDAVTLGDANLVAAVVEEKGHEGIFGPAGIVDDGSGEKTGEDEVSIRRPAEGINDVAEGLVAVVEFLAFEKTAALAVGVLEPGVIVLEVVELGFEVAMNGIDDAVVGSKREGSDVFVDGLEGLIEILGEGGGNGAAAQEDAEQRTHRAEPEQAVRGAGTGHGLCATSLYGMWRRVGIAARGLRGFELHELDAGEVGVIDVEGPFAVAADLGLVGGLEAVSAEASDGALNLFDS